MDKLCVDILDMTSGEAFDIGKALKYVDDKLNILYIYNKTLNVYLQKKYNYDLEYPNIEYDNVVDIYNERFSYMKAEDAIDELCKESEQIIRTLEDI